LVFTTVLYILSYFFFFNATPTPDLYPLSLHDALPICDRLGARRRPPLRQRSGRCPCLGEQRGAGLARVVPEARGDRGLCGATRADRKSTRLNSSHVAISYAVFCLKKKKTNIDTTSKCS